MLSVFALPVLVVLAQAASAQTQTPQTVTRVLLDDRPVVITLSVQPDPETVLRKRLAAQPDDIAVMLDLAKLLYDRKRLDEATLLVTVALDRLRREGAVQSATPVSRINVDPAVPRELPVRVGGDVREPKKIKDVKPNYPEAAQRARLSGVVIMEIIVDVDGNVASVKVLRGQPEFDEAAVAAVRQWKYTPTVLNGVAVPVVMTVTVTFTIF